MQIVAVLIVSFLLLGVYWALLVKSKKRADEEKKQWNEWRDSVLDVLTSMKQRLVK